MLGKVLVANRGEMVFKLLEKKGIKEAVMTNVGNRLTKGYSTVGLALFFVYYFLRKSFQPDTEREKLFLYVPLCFWN